MADYPNTFSNTPKAKDTGDAAAKQILNYRIVLANILKYAIPKYSSFSIEDIIKMIPASQKTPDALYVQAENSEDLEDKKHINFDVLFPVNGMESDKVCIWCDIEPQNQYMIKSENKQSYDLAARGVYYLARMLSRQLSSGEDTSNYRHLHKCYSIWICFDNIDNRDWEPTVTRYVFSPAKILDIDSEPPKHEHDAADLMELIIVRAGGNSSNTKSLIGLVNTLWRDVSRLPEYIPETYEGYNTIRKEAVHMCDMREVGIAEGEIKKAIKVVQNLLKSKIPLDSALKLAEIDEKTYNCYKNAYTAENNTSEI